MKVERNAYAFPKYCSRNKGNNKNPKGKGRKALLNKTEEPFEMAGDEHHTRYCCHDIKAMLQCT